MPFVFHFLAENVFNPTNPFLGLFLFLGWSLCNALLLILAFVFAIIGICDRRTPTRSCSKILARLGCFFVVLPFVLFTAFAVFMILVDVYDMDMLEIFDALGL